jgi:membrane dipeptidase
MVTFVPGFLDPKVWDWSQRRSGEEARLKSRFSYSKASVAEGLKAWEASNPRPRVTAAQVADHIEYIVKTAGHDHVGIGGDLDGIPYGVERLDSADGYPLLFAELIRRGWTDENLAKLAGGNVLRALRGAEATASAMKDVAPSLAVLEKPAANP